MSFVFAGRKALMLCAAALTWAGAAAAQSEPVTLPRLAALVGKGAQVSAAIVDLETGSTVAALNANQRVSPASTTKVLVGIKALELWPVDTSFETRLMSQKPPSSGGVLDGDVFLVSDPDPSLDHRQLLQLASLLRMRGVQEITGRLIAVTAPFPALGCETKDRCDAVKQSATAYNAPIGGIGVDYGAWCVEVQPTSPGQNAIVQSCAGTPLPVAVDGTVKTVAGSNVAWWLDRRSPGGVDTLAVGGSIGANASAQQEYRAMGNPALGVAQLMAGLLQAQGIAVRGGAAFTDQKPSGVNTLVKTEGMQLKEQVGRMLRYSNNYTSDLLTLKIAKHLGMPTHTLAEAAKALAQHVAAVRGDPANPPELFSGSGLTPENRISASELNAALAAEYQTTRDFPALYGSLTVPRQAPFRYVKGGSERWMDRVALKTGSMSVPRSVCGVTGYLRKSNGGFMAFTAIVNGGPSWPQVPMYQAIGAIREDVDALLARY